MASTAKALKDALRTDYLEQTMEHFKAEGEEVLQTGNGDFCMPVVDKEGNEAWVQVVIKIPSGSRDGEPFDGYGLADYYSMKQEEKKAKAAEDARKKEEKKAKDAASRAAKQAAREANMKRKERAE